MKQVLLILTTIAFVLNNQSTMNAQDSSRIADAFFSNNHPALLFNVSALDLIPYEGGIGEAFYGNQDLLWRVSLGFGVYSEREERSQSKALVRYPEVTQNRYSINALFSPIFIIDRFDPGFLFLSPFVRGIYRKNYYQSAYIDSFKVNNYESKSSSWSIGLGGSVGVGISISKRIALTAEYRVFTEYSKWDDHNESIDNMYVPTLVITETKHSAWKIGQEATFTLYYKL